MTTQPKIGVLTMALLEDAYNKTAHMRPAATETARGVARALEPYGTVVHPGLVEDEEQAAAASAARRDPAQGSPCQSARLPFPRSRSMRRTPCRGQPLRPQPALSHQARILPA